MGGVLAAAPAVPAVAAGYWDLNVLLSFIKGYTLTEVVGGLGAVMRTTLLCIPPGKFFDVTVSVFLHASACSISCRVRHGRGKGSVRDIGNHVPIAGKGVNVRFAIHPTTGRMPGPVQRPACRSIGALRQPVSSPVFPSTHFKITSQSCWRWTR